jgi:hypothetical protein
MNSLLKKGSSIVYPEEKEKKNCLPFSANVSLGMRIEANYTTAPIGLKAEAKDSFPKRGF